MHIRQEKKEDLFKYDVEIISLSPDCDAVEIVLFEEDLLDDLVLVAPRRLLNQLEPSPCCHVLQQRIQVESLKSDLK